MVITANSNMAKCSLVPPGDEAAGMKISSSYTACIGLAPAAGVKAAIRGVVRKTTTWDVHLLLSKMVLQMLLLQDNVLAFIHGVRSKLFQFKSYYMTHTECLLRFSTITKSSTSNGS